MEIVLASGNEHKVKEINDIVKNYDIKFVLPPKEFNPIENGETFEENSLIKAQAAWELTHNWVLADDSGLCIDALHGAPGIYSARYAETPQRRIARVLKEIENVDENDRTARFKCAMTLLNPKGEKVFTYTGVCEGSIVREQRGQNGFGYDPIFLLQNNTKTMAELTEDEKNKLSHRAKALNEVINYVLAVCF